MGRIKWKCAVLVFLLPFIIFAEVNIETLESKAADGDGSALYQLGYIYENGQGVSVDLKKARVYYKKAVEAGNKDARLALGLMQELESEKSGRKSTHSTKVKVGRVKNILGDLDKDAINELIAEAKTGDAEAEYQLGAAYDSGYGVKRDSRKALKWYKRSAKHGYKPAIQLLEVLEMMGK